MKIRIDRPVTIDIDIKEFVKDSVEILEDKIEEVLSEIELSISDIPDDERQKMYSIAQDTFLQGLARLLISTN